VTRTLAQNDVDHSELQVEWKNCTTLDADMTEEDKEKDNRGRGLTEDTGVG